MKNDPIIQDFLSFLDASPTAWHAVDSIKQRLKDVGFLELKENARWKLESQKAYVVTRNGSSLCAFVTPKELPEDLLLLASHTDSPSLKLKPKAEFKKQKAVLLGVEVYGSPILSSWLNRDLGIAGNVIYQDSKGKIGESLVRFDQTPVMIPQLAIHLDREVNDKGLQLNKQEHLNALAGLETSLKDASFIETLLKTEMDCAQLIGHDLFLYPLEKPALIGYNQAFISAYRIDSLSSVHSAMTALLNSLEPIEKGIKMIIFWNHEEIGSHTPQGAESNFLNQMLERIMNGFQASREDYFRLLHRSTCISIDLAHALHPNYVEKHDPQHQPILGQGVVIKTNAQNRYATTAHSALPIQLAAKLKNIPLQYFVSRNDIPCGTTIGPLQACLTGISTVDIGCGQLSMHSCREIMATQDHLDMCLLLQTLLERATLSTY